jgi:hypothetical protein
MTAAGGDKGRILLSVTGWSPDVWRDELQKAAPDRPVVLEPEGPRDPSIRYAVVWKQRPGILKDLPQSPGDLFDRRRRRSYLPGPACAGCADRAGRLR